MPIRHFSDDASYATRALQIYLILIGAAHRRQTLTYGQLAELMGYEQAAGVLAGMLNRVMDWCNNNGLPALTAIVVNNISGIPGSGLGTVENNDFPAEQQKVYKYSWYLIFPPTLDELGN